MATVNGTNGNDKRVLGTRGNDTINGRRGNDWLEGGKGRDTYVFDSKFGSDVVADDNSDGGSNAGDVIHFRADRFSDIRSVRVTGSGSGGNMIITTKNGTVNVRNYKTRKDRIETIRFKDATFSWNGRGYNVRGSGIATAARKMGIRSNTGDDLGVEALARVLRDTFGRGFKDPLGWLGVARANRGDGYNDYNHPFRDDIYGDGPRGCNGCPPIVLDLDRDGSLDLVSNDQGGWVGPSDGFLAVDRDGSGAIDNMGEIALLEEDARARTDLEGLAYGFDGNGDGVVNAVDERFAELRVFQDVDGNGVSGPGELMTLEEAGITSIDVAGVPYEGEPSVVQEKAGNQVFGVTTVAYDDGSFGIAGDVSLGSDHSSVAEGSGADAPGDAIEQLTADVARLTSTVDNLVNAIAAMPAQEGCGGRCADQINRPTPTLLAA